VPDTFPSYPGEHNMFGACLIQEVKYSLIVMIVGQYDRKLTVITKQKLNKLAIGKEKVAARHLVSCAAEHVSIRITKHL
jgi:hypothetical protein